MYLKAVFFISICFFGGRHALSQPGGKSIFSTMQLVTSPRIAALGADFTAINDMDINIERVSPSFLTPSSHHKLGLAIIDYYAGISYGHVVYNHYFKKQGSFIGSIQFLNGGKFVEADETGQILGNFNVGEYIFQIGWGRALSKRFAMGSNLKVAYSSFDTYTSSAIAIDLSCAYMSADSLFMMVGNIKNIGRPIKSYVPGVNYSLPYTIQVGLAKKLAHTPLTISLLGIHLQKFDLSYDNPFDPISTTNLLTGEVTEKSKFSIFSDNFLNILF